VVVIPTKFKDMYGLADCVDVFIPIGKLTNSMHIEPVGATAGPPH
jgi:hypothetical protein